MFSLPNNFHIPPQATSNSNCIQVTEEDNRENWLELKVNIEDVTKSNAVFSGESVHKMSMALSIHIKVLFAKTFDAPPSNLAFGASSSSSVRSNILVLFKFVKSDILDSTIYAITCNSQELGLIDTTYFTDNDCWYLVHERKTTNFSFDVGLTSRVIKNDKPFKVLYEDTELTDFQLVGEGGSSVKIHGAVLAAQCPAVIKKIQEKKIKGGVLEYTGVQMETLQHFKDYIYLHVLPNDNIEQLLLLASRVMMPELEKKCIEKITNSLTANNLYQMTEFAHQHTIKELYVSILECIQKGKIKVSDVRASLKLPDI